MSHSARSARFERTCMRACIAVCVESHEGASVGGKRRESTNRVGERASEREEQATLRELATTEERDRCVVHVRTPHFH